MERGILFSGPMVKALLTGTKTQTRRVVKPQPDRVRDGEPYWNVGGYRVYSFRGVTNPLRMGTHNPLACPYGKPGDILFVRESFQPILADGVKFRDADYGNGNGYAIRYPATDGVIDFYDEVNDRITCSVKPSIHLPKWASRIWLEITDVRVERVSQISEEDAKAEGVEPNHYADLRPDGEMRTGESIAYRSSFHDLWEILNAKRGFSFNDGPWVWVISFRRIEKPEEKGMED